MFPYHRRSVLQGLDQLRSPPPERYLNLFIRRYIDNGNPKEVNYVKFCDDVDNISEMLETVIKGISTNEKPVFDNTDQIVKDTSVINLLL